MGASPESQSSPPASTQYRAAGRQQWQDAARGIGIIFVVHGHVILGLIAAGLLPDTYGTQLWAYAIYTFHMPLFFFLAGLNAERSLRKGAAPFLGSKIWTIVYPYFLWSFLQGMVQIVMSRATNEVVRFEHLGDILWRPLGQFWFLYALMLCHMAAALLPRQRIVLVVDGAAAFAAALFLPVNVWAAALHQFLFYALGMSLAGFLSRWEPPRGSGLVTITAAIWIAFGVAAVIGLSLDPKADTLAGLPAALLGIAGMLGLSMMLSGGAARIFAATGALSMTIYVLHVMAGSGARVAIAKLGMPADPTLHVVAGTLFGVGLPVIAHRVMERLNLLSYLGLSPPEWVALEGAARRANQVGAWTRHQVVAGLRPVWSPRQRR